MTIGYPLKPQNALWGI